MKAAQQNDGAAPLRSSHNETPDQSADVERLFDRIRRAGPDERVVLLAAITDPVVRAEVASPIDADRDTGVTVATVISEGCPRRRTV